MGQREHSSDISRAEICSTDEIGVKPELHADYRTRRARGRYRIYSRTQ